MNGMTIFDDLRASHEVQRSLAGTMTHARASADKRRAAFLALARELDAHATAEERHLYVPLLLDDAGLSVSRHALADHHNAEKLVEQLRGVDPGTAQFDAITKQLAAEVRDHLSEEEHGTFQLAGKLLSKARQNELAREYRAEYAKRGGPVRDVTKTSSAKSKSHRAQIGYRWSMIKSSIFLGGIVVGCVFGSMLSDDQRALVRDRVTRAGNGPRTWGVKSAAHDVGDSVFDAAVSVVEDAADQATTVAGELGNKASVNN